MGPLLAQADLDAAGGACICADYFFPRDAPGKEGVTAVALCDRQAVWLAGHVVSSKGSGTQEAVGQVLRDLRRMGHHGKIVVKTDQESAIIDLLRTVAKERGEARTVFETAARSDSKGNGEAEKAVQSIEEMVRTLMVDLEERCGEPLSVTEPFFEWLMEHACDLLNKYHVRKGNQTAWEAIKRGPYTGDVYLFGAPVMHRVSGPVQGGVVHERWNDGVYLGTQFSSGEHIVAMPDGKVVRALAIQLKPGGVPTTKEVLGRDRVWTGWRQCGDQAKEFRPNQKG